MLKILVIALMVTCFRGLVLLLEGSLFKDFTVDWFFFIKLLVCPIFIFILASMLSVIAAGLYCIFMLPVISSF